MYSRTYQHYVTGLLLLVYICNLTDRAVFSLLMEPIKGEFALSDSELGFLAGPALSLCYAVFGIPIARWADRSNRINIMAAAIVVWSSIVMLTALTAKFWHLALARIGVGIGEAGFSAIAQSVIADYHSVADRTRALSTFMLGIPIAGVVSSLMAGWVNESHGWRAVFIVAGVPGLVLALLMKTTVKEPPRGTHGPTPAQVEQPPLSAVFATLWRRRALRHLAIGMTLLNMLAGGVLGWTAPFFIRTHGMSTGELGTWLAVIAGAGGGIGILLSGQSARRLHVTDERVQMRLLAATAVCAWPLLATLLTWPDKTVALLVTFVATAVLNFFYAPSFSLVQSLCAPNMRATIVSIVIFLQILAAGIVGLQLVGIISDALAARFGVDALRWAMMSMTPAALWAAWHLWRAATFIRDDLSEAGSTLGEPLARHG